MINVLQPFEFETVTVNEYGQVVERRIKQARSFKLKLKQEVMLEMVEIPHGSFLMGSTMSEDEGRDNERPQHSVNVSAFFMGKFPITQAQWHAIMHSLPQMSEEFYGDDLPAVNVWWEQAQEFCTRLSQLSGQSFRLPTEAEWEYACRAGSATPFNCGLTITPDIVNYNGNQPYAQAPKGEYRQLTTPVGHFKIANRFGLYDMHGNIWEWCADVWHADYQGAPNDGSAWMSGGDQSYFVQRGGSWRNHATLCRAAFRVGDIAHNSDHLVGLRICI